MSNCELINNGIGHLVDEWMETRTEERISEGDRCDECGFEIPKGIEYEHLVIIDNEGDETRIKICHDCGSILANLVDLHCAMMLWHDMEEHIKHIDFEGFPDECLAKLTPRARQMIFDLYDEYLDMEE